MTPSNWILTHTGTHFFPLGPTPEMIDLRDIALGLANTARFSKHTRPAYSVAQHSVLMVRRGGLATREERQWALMHDAAEAYLFDVPKPLKRELGWKTEGDRWMAFDAVEAGILRVVAERFKLAWPVPESVWVADGRMLATEREAFFPDDPAWGCDEAYPWGIYGVWDSIRAEVDWLGEAGELGLT